MNKMKKMIGLLVFVAAFCFGIVATPETAKAAIMQDLKFDETYNIESDKDYYKFNMVLQTSGNVKFKFISESTAGYIVLEIYDETEEELIEVTYGGSFSTDYDLKAGNYIVYLTGDRGKPPYLDGLFATEFTDAKETYKENALDTNDQSGVASNIKSIKNKTIKGQLAENDRVDYYKFKLTKSKKLTLTFKSVLKNAELHLYNSKLDYELRKELAAGTNKFTEVLPAGTYYVSFSIGDNDATSNYTLQLKTSDLKKAAFKSVKSSSKKTVKTTWKKASGVDGYQIQIATNSKFTKGKKSYTTTKTSYTMKKLKSKKTYYVKIRTYTIAENGEKCYSDWSKAKKIKVK